MMAVMMHQLWSKSGELTASTPQPVYDHCLGINCSPPQPVSAKERPGLSLETERLAGASRYSQSHLKKFHVPLLLGRASTSLKARWATLGITLVSATKTSNRLSVSSSLWVNHKMMIIMTISWEWWKWFHNSMSIMMKISMLIMTILLFCKTHFLLQALRLLRRV